MAKVICGPIVGLVTDSSAIIVLEIDKESDIRCVLKDRRSGADFNVTKRLPARGPRAFVFDGLKSNTRYDIHVENVGGRSSVGRFKTLSEKIENINIAIISCDRPKYKSPCNMWDELVKSIKVDNIHLVLHIGDNVYIDEDVSEELNNKDIIHSDDLFDKSQVDQTIPYVAARRLLRGISNAEWETKRDAILEIYRSKYRSVFGRKEKARVLSSVSNLMILDDHEFRDDFGSQADDSDPSSVEFFLGSIALQAYHEYQRQLWDPDVLSKSDTLVNEFYTITHGPVGIMMLDSRLTRAIYKHKRMQGDNSYYGKHQRQAITENFNKENVRLWLFVSSLPLMFLRKTLHKLSAKTNFNDDLEDFIAVNYEHELVPLLKEMHQWKEKRTGGEESDIVILSGDVHLGGFTDIYYETDDRKSLVCRQIVSSAINNKPNSSLEGLVMQTLLHFNEKYGDYSYDHYDWTSKCNFALLRISVQNEHLHYTVSMHAHQDVVTKDSYARNWNTGISSRCCNVL